ncbi:MAG TPA: S8 family serine peptidase [Gaiellaceae bacterium]
MRILPLLVACALLCMTIALSAAGGPTKSAGTAARTYVVVYAKDASLAQARAAVRAAGGRIMKENKAVGVATVRTGNANFVRQADAQAALDGAAADRPIGYSKPALRPKADEAKLDLLLSRARAEERAGGRSHHEGGRSEPLADLQWNMQMLDATKEGSYGKERGSHHVLVGIIDTGIDASHPDLRANFNHRLSRNFTTDIPLIDGPCADEPDQSCSDPADVDEGGHGTHVAGIVGAAINGLGVSGVAPNVSLVNLRGGQDSGYFFLQESVDALTYAGNHGIDVVNMSYYIDPWLFNCADNPADSPDEQAQQRTVVEATQRALDYAHRHGVTLVSALGNDHTDLGNPTVDDTSPDFPPGTAHHRTVNNSCLDLPTEGRHVIGVSALGPTETKADYSNWGTEQTNVSAPGGFFRDFVGTPQFMTPGNLVLSTYPKALAREEGLIDEDGNPTDDFTIKDCRGSTCGIYEYLQGTSMASPHVTGVAALIVSKYGHWRHGDFGLNPDRVKRILYKTAVDHACPTPRLFDYGPYGRDDSYDAYCAGSPRFNGFYGQGIVNALNAVTHRHHH